jgi:hypothetical protein
MRISALVEKHRAMGYARMGDAGRAFARYNKFAVGEKIYTAQASGSPSGRWKSVLKRMSRRQQLTLPEAEKISKTEPGALAVNVRPQHKLPE